jgi:hypothetical protein
LRVVTDYIATAKTDQIAQKFQTLADNYAAHESALRVKTNKLYLLSNSQAANVVSGTLSAELTGIVPEKANRIAGRQTAIIQSIY